MKPILGYILFFIFLFLLISSCTKEEITRINKTTITTASVNQSSIYRSDTIDILFTGGDYTYYYTIPDTAIWESAVPLVYVDFSEGFEALPHRHDLDNGDYLVINQKHFFNQVWIFSEDRSGLDIGDIDAKAIITYLPIQ